MADLEGRVALVTGASRGIGAATARALATAGAKVIVTDVADTAALAAELGGFARRQDVTSESEWAETMAFARAADAICYLASDRAAFVTGSELVVDGGYTAQ